MSYAEFAFVLEILKFPGLELGFNLGLKLGWQTENEGLTFKSMFNT